MISMKDTLKEIDLKGMEPCIGQSLMRIIRNKCWKSLLVTFLEGKELMVKCILEMEIYTLENSKIINLKTTMENIFLLKIETPLKVSSKMVK